MAKTKTYISSRNELQTIFDNAPAAITLENSEGKILNANNAAAAIFNLKSNEELINKNIKSIFDKYKILDINGVELKFEDRPAAKLLNGLQNVEEFLTFIHKKTGKKKYLLIKATLTTDTDSNEQKIIKSFKDVSETFEEQKQRDFFVGTLSHEIKNPVASIKAYAQLLKRRITNKRNKSYAYANNIESQTDRITKIVNDIFDATKFTTGKFILNKRRINLDKTIQRTVASFSLTTPTRTIIQKGKTNLDLNLDEDRFVQVLINLLSNAVKYSGPKKKIEVSARNKGDYVAVSVKDYGVGIPKKHQAEIFKIFRVVPAGTLNRKHGLGMGLAISSSIIKAHGGEILVRSKVREGSKFTIKLPLN